jgi:hypothetical protein
MPGVLEREKSGYRVIDGIITPIIAKEQIRSIQAALDSPYKYRAAAEHIKTALVLYADRKMPDYRNSVKESISAIEAVAKIISGKDKADLAAALKIIDANKPMHEAFKQVLQKLYVYASDSKGVRHALLDETAIYDRRVQRVRDVSYFPRVKTRLCVRVFARAGTPKNPWYPTAPTAPIFGQPSMGDWDSVMVEVGRELQITEVFDPNENLNDP